MKAGSYRSLLSRFQKALVFVGGGAADVAHSRQFADVQLPVFVGGIVPQKYGGDFLFCGRRPLQMVLFLQHPFPGIVLNIFPNLVVILLIADHMVVVGPLKNNRSNISMRKQLACRNNMRNYCIRRGRRPRRPIYHRFVNLQDQMDMIWHDNIFIHFNARDAIAVYDMLLRNFTDGC